LSLRGGAADTLAIACVGQQGDEPLAWRLFAFDLERPFSQQAPRVLPLSIREAPIDLRAADLDGDASPELILTAFTSGASAYRVEATAAGRRVVPLGRAFIGSRTDLDRWRSGSP
jgi:hypothetical protein